MAAGSSSRFGSNKLLALLEGKPLYTYILETLPADAFTRIAVVSGTPEILREAEHRGFIPIVNARPEEGPRRTIRLGLGRMLDLPSCMFCVCDQPGMRQETLRRLCRGPAEKIIAASCGGVRGNPVLFPHTLYDELLALSLGESGSAVIRRHPEMLSLVNCGTAAEMKDIDTRHDLELFRRADTSVTA